MDALNLVAKHGDGRLPESKRPQRRAAALGPFLERARSGAGG